ncbi:hypothetical protein BJX66DRAFT_151751 [Aspergillus keveii]|uniref:Uncharacterized protein n=1 Tax=Aspergillus keveii TaxID=714993 RepID=A0ABR4GNQ4_9EURO
MRCPLLPPNAWHYQYFRDVDTGNEFADWFCILIDAGMLWEASRILRSLLPIMSFLPAQCNGALLRYNAGTTGSPAELLAGLMLSMYQARFLLHYALSVRWKKMPQHLILWYYNRGRAKLRLAEQIEQMISVGHTSPLSLAVALDRISFDLFDSALDADSMAALSRILFEADRRQDLRSQILARLSILTYQDEGSMDWRDLHSLFDLCQVDCGNAVEYIHIWVMFAMWTLRFRTGLFKPGFDVHTVIMSEHTSKLPTDRSNWYRWMTLLHDRCLHPGQFSPKELTPSHRLQGDYRLQSDVPKYWTSHNALQERLASYLGREGILPLKKRQPGRSWKFQSQRTSSPLVSSWHIEPVSTPPARAEITPTNSSNWRQEGIARNKKDSMPPSQGDSQSTSAPPYRMVPPHGPEPPAVSDVYKHKDPSPEASK